MVLSTGMHTYLLVIIVYLIYFYMLIVHVYLSDRPLVRTYYYVSIVHVCVCVCMRARACLLVCLSIYVAHIYVGGRVGTIHYF